MIKKIVMSILMGVLLAGLVIAPVGCCSRTAVDGTVTKSFSNCLSSSQDMVCSPSPAVMATLAAAGPILTYLAAILAPGSELLVGILTSQATINSIQAGLCVTVTELNNLIKVLSSSEVALAQAQLTKQAFTMKKAAPNTVNVQPLVDWGKTAKQ